MLKDLPTVAELFGLDGLEGYHGPEDAVSTYCFRPNGLLPIEQVLAIDMISGSVRVSQENSIIQETRLNELETRLFTALVLSHPCSVAGYQMLALYEMRDIVAVKGELERARQEQRRDELMQPVEDLITACNHKIRSLGLVIHRESEYLLKPENQYQA